jgi:hypothetical protein
MTITLDYEHTVLIPALTDALIAPLSSTHDVDTEAIPALPEYYDGPTAKMLRLPKYAKQQKVLEVASSGKQREAMRSMQEPGYSVWAWFPIALFLAVFAFYAYLLLFGVQHANEVMYVVLVQWRW